MKLLLSLLLFSSCLISCGKTTEIPAVTEAIKPFVESKKTMGAVTLVANQNSILHLKAQGYADVEANRIMKSDDLFWIASMTKPMTAVAAMMLQEEGKLSLTDPVSKYIPEFKELKNAAGEPVEITILQCLNHTSGMADISNNEWAPHSILADLIPIYVSKPLLSTPGEKWKYSQSSINTVGHIVEILSGKSFPDFLEQRLFQPLGMKDTTFYPTLDQQKRIAISYHWEKQTAHRPSLIQNKSLENTTRIPFPNAGLFSTAEDCLAFCQMLLNKGTYEGKRLLSSESVIALSSVTTGNLNTGFTSGNGWGVGVIITKKPQGPTAALSPGTYGHGGAHGTQMWIDPIKKRIDILMVQRVAVPNGDGSPLRAAFHTAAATYENE